MAGSPTTTGGGSPLGKYTQAVAAIMAVLVVTAWIAGAFLNAAGYLPVEPAGLQGVALLAVGAVFGSQTTVNGVKGQIAAVHARLDALGAPSASVVASSQEGPSSGNPNAA